MATEPTISVVTIVYNRLDDFKKTFQNVIIQTYPHIEYVVIDGGSTDGTAEFIQANQEHIDYWVSEPDKGIYDAMNKGAAAATGEWIIFMNAGDTFFAEDTVAQVVPYLIEPYDVVYGGAEIVLPDRYQTRTFQRAPGSLSDLWRELPTCHQSIFVRRDLQVKYGFDTRLKWCADHNLFVKIYAAGHQFRAVTTIVSRFDASSGETKNVLIHTKESWHNSKYLAGPLKRHPYFIKQYISFFLWQNVVRKIRNLLPPAWVIALRRYRGTYEPN